MLLYTFSVIGAVAVGLCIAEELPVTICKRNSPNYSNCLKLAIEEAWPRFVKGLPEFNFPSLDPLSYEYGELEFERNEIYGKVVLSNVINKGLTNVKFFSVKPHFLDDGFRLEIDSNVPKMYIKGDCKAEGKIGGFQMGGKGRFNLTLENIRGTWDLIGNVTNDRWTVERFHFLPTIGSLKMHFDDLFNGNEELSENIDPASASEVGRRVNLNLPGILEDVHDIHKRKQLREHGIDGLHVVAGIFSGNSPFLSLSMVLISREIREAQGFILAASGRIQNERELAGVKDERVFQL